MSFVDLTNFINALVWMYVFVLSDQANSGVAVRYDASARLVRLMSHEEEEGDCSEEDGDSDGCKVAGLAPEIEMGRISKLKHEVEAMQQMFESALAISDDEMSAECSGDVPVQCAEPVVDVPAKHVEPAVDGTAKLSELAEDESTKPDEPLVDVPNKRRRRTHAQIAQDKQDAVDRFDAASLALRNYEAGRAKAKAVAEPTVVAEPTAVAVEPPAVAPGKERPMQRQSLQLSQR